jgi:hypothetical protein
MDRIQLQYPYEIFCQSFSSESSFERTINFIFKAKGNSGLEISGLDDDDDDDENNEIVPLAPEDEIKNERFDNPSGGGSIMLSEAGMPDDGNKAPDIPSYGVWLRNSPCDYRPCLNQGVSVAVFFSFIFKLNHCISKICQSSTGNSYHCSCR